MSVRFSSLFVCLLVTVYYGCADPVSFINKCKLGDSKCLVKSTQAAVPIYSVGVSNPKIAPIDPLIIKNLNATSKGLTLIITDATLTGLKGCQITKMGWDLNPTKLEAQALCDINLEGQYVMSGQLLFLPIEGNGPVHVKLNKILLTVEANIENKDGKDGKNHWSIKSWSHKFQLQEKANVVFENLFNTNKELGKATSDFVASSGNEIITEVGPPVIKAIVSKLISNVNKFFHTVPYEDLVDVQ